MLPPAHRLTDSSTFRHVVRNGRRSGRTTLVVHVICQNPDSQHTSRAAAPSAASDAPTKVGFVVSKAVGNAVTRNRVQRRLRHAARAELFTDTGAVLPRTGCTLVVRALPPAAGASYADLSADLHAGLERALRRTSARSSRGSTS